MYTREQINKLGVQELKEYLESLETSEELEEALNLLDVPTEEDYIQAHNTLDDGIYDSEGRLIGEKHPED